MAETTEAEADSADEDVETFAWAQQTPTTRIEGEPIEMIYPGTVGGSVEQNDDSFGIRLRDPTVVRGTLFRNTKKTADETMGDIVDEDSTTPTDYRIADEEDQAVDFDREGNLKSGETSTVDGDSANRYEEGEFDEDEVIVWYNGMAGQRLGRTLDFNGLPYARFTDDGYLVKGLYQAPNGWRNANGSERGEMARNDKAPRVARLPILREDIDTVLIDISRYNGGRGYEAHIFEPEAFEDEFGSLDHPTSDISRNDYGQLEADSEIDWNYEDEADSILEEAGVDMMLFHGDGWQEEPQNAQYQSTGTGDFSIDADSGSGVDEEAVVENQMEFVGMLVSQMEADDAADGQTPDEYLNPDLEGLIQKNADAFDVVPAEDPSVGLSIEDVRRAVYEEIAWLSVEDLE